MAVSGKTASPHEIPYFLGTDKPPDMAAVTKAIAERTAVRLDAIAPKQIVGAAKKQLLIANASGVVTAVTASGDVTNDESGVFSIGANKLATGMYQDGSVTPAKLSAGAKPFTWYTPKVIAAEEARANAAYGTLATADEIKEVVVPAGALLLLGYSALWKMSALNTGKAAFFIGANQLKVPSGEAAAPIMQEAECNSAAGFVGLSSSYSGLSSGNGNNSFVTTGMALMAPPVGATPGIGGIAVVQRLAAGTYNITVQYKMSSGTITVKERALWACVLGA